ncbi:hypothetical protein R8Z50_21890 [Longispora sp. K20-0274]|uniref:hypothetical protein n=1 Tax=Longispora sp. K20-0274 TaxID=3088255 RepID=UPI00399A26DE
MSWRIAASIFLVLHGLVHVAIYPPPSSPNAPFDPHRSWLLSRFGVNDPTARRIAVVTSVIVAAAFVVAGGLLLAGAGWWAAFADAAAAGSLLLLGAYYHPWLTFGLLLDVAVIVAAVTQPLEI